MTQSQSLRLTHVESILQTLTQHQENFLVLVTEIRDIRSDIRCILDRLD